MSCMSNRSQVRFVEYGENSLPGCLGENAAVAESGIFRANSVKHVDSEITVTRQDASRRQYVPGALYHDRHDRQAALDGGSEGACAKPVQARIRMKGTFRKQRERFAGRRRSQQVSCVPGAGRGGETLDEPRADTAQKKMGQRHLLHLALDHESEPRRQERLQDQPVQITRVVGDDDAMAGGDSIDAGQPGVNAGGDQPGSGCTGNPAPAAFKAGNQECR